MECIVSRMGVTQGVVLKTLFYDFCKFTQLFSMDGLGS